MCVFHSQMHVPIRAWKCRTNISTGMHTKIMMNTHEVQKFPVAKTVFQAQVPYSREVKKSCHRYLPGGSCFSCIICYMHIHCT